MNQNKKHIINDNNNNNNYGACLNNSLLQLYYSFYPEMLFLLQLLFYNVLSWSLSLHC